MREAELKVAHFLEALTLVIAEVDLERSQIVLELGKRAPGAVDTLRFAKPGVVTLRCDIHPEMTGYVVVTPNHAFARADSAGLWRLPDLPAGEYVVHTWRPDRGETKHTVHMPAHGDTLLSLRW